MESYSYEQLWFEITGGKRLCVSMTFWTLAFKFIPTRNSRAEPLTQQDGGFLPILRQLILQPVHGPRAAQILGTPTSQLSLIQGDTKRVLLQFALQKLT